MIPAGEWARCEPWIEAALEHTRGAYVLADVVAALEAGEAHFWPGEHACMVTEFWQLPREKAINVWLAGGDLEEGGKGLAELVDRLRPCVEAWAKLQGCTKALIAGRPGWARALRDKGFEVFWTQLGKDL